MRQDTDQHFTGHPSSNRVTVYEAAERLGVTVDAIRKRIQRDTIPHERQEDGRVYVLLDAASKVQDTNQDNYQTAKDELVESLQEQVSYLKAVIATRDEELRRKDHILAALTERIPELPPPDAPSPNPRESSETLTEESGKDDVPPEQEKRVSWWRRLFN
jgi:hypothetical protein